jgi:hypothetical protein
MEDRIGVNDPAGWTGPASLAGAIDDLVVSDVRMVHLESMDDDAAFLALYKADGSEVRIWIRARVESRPGRRVVLDMREEQ